MAEERLQKILANAGIASRRKAEELIVTGHVSVNGVTVTELGSKADLAVDEVKCDGQRLKAPKHYVYFAFNKPKNVMTTVNDPERRETVMHFFKGLKERIYPVGRLDYASEGLLLLTNDGEFANLISSPSAHVPKTYLVKVNGILTAEQQETFRRGIPMHGKRTAPAKLKVVRSTVNPWYEVTIAEGRQNQIRIMFKHFGFLVEKLRRIRIGFLDLEGLKGGAYRTLTREEVERFRRMLKMDGAEADKASEQTGRESNAKPAAARNSNPPVQPFRSPRAPARDMRRPRPTAKPSGNPRFPVQQPRGERPAAQDFRGSRPSGGPPARIPRAPMPPERGDRPPARAFRGPRSPERTGDRTSAPGQTSGFRQNDRAARSSRPSGPPARGPRRPAQDSEESRPSRQSSRGSGPFPAPERGGRPPGPPSQGPRPPVRNARGPSGTGRPPSQLSREFGRKGPGERSFGQSRPPARGSRPPGKGRKPTRD
jgi:23S rRNA pseudouridine2605 synthase